MSNSRLFAALAFAIAASTATVTASAADLDGIRKANEIKVAVYKDFSPFASVEGGSVKGIDADLARALAEAIGVPVFIKSQPPGESISDDLRNAVWKGHYLDGLIVDVMVHIPVTPDLAKENDKVKIIAPYYQEAVVFASRPGTFPSGVSLESFRTRKLGVALATMSDMIALTTDKGALINNVIHYRTLTEAAQGLKRGEIAAILGDRGETEAALNGQSVSYETVPITEHTVGRTSWPVGVAVKAENEALANEVSTVINRLVSDGTVRKFFADRGMSYNPPQ